MKKFYILFITALIVFIPLKTNAFCLFGCDDEVVIINSYNNSGYDYNGNYYNYNQVARPPIHNTPIYNYDRPVYEPLDVSCYSSKTFANVGDTITWASSSFGGNGSYYVSWRGTDGFSGTGQSSTMRYNSPGSKTASVTVVSGNQTVSKNCNSISVSGYDYNNSPQTPIYNYNDRDNRDVGRRNNRDDRDRRDDTYGRRNRNSNDSCVISRSSRDNNCYQRPR